MGCFSFICQKSGKPVNSSSFKGDRVHLFLLKDGKVIEHMYGNYDSYGRVFSDKKDPKDTSLTDASSFEWKMDWGIVVDLMFDKDRSNGIAAILEPFWKEGDPYPTERSNDDPDQGWGRLKNSDKVDHPYHKITVINNDFFEGEVEEIECEIIEDIDDETLVVKLGSDPSIKCKVKYMNERWEIVEDMGYTDPDREPVSSKSYKVSWEIEVDADSPLEAAKEAQRWMQAKGDSWQFYVQKNGHNEPIFSVDLQEEDKDAVIKVAMGNYTPLIKE